MVDLELAILFRPGEPALPDTPPAAGERRTPADEDGPPPRADAEGDREPAEGAASVPAAPLPQPPAARSPAASPETAVAAAGGDGDAGAASPGTGTAAGTVVGATPGADKEPAGALVAGDAVFPEANAGDMPTEPGNDWPASRVQRRAAGTADMAMAAVGKTAVPVGAVAAGTQDVAAAVIVPAGPGGGRRPEAAGQPTAAMGAGPTPTRPGTAAPTEGIAPGSAPVTSSTNGLVAQSTLVSAMAASSTEDAAGPMAGTDPASAAGGASPTDAIAAAGAAAGDGGGFESDGDPGNEPAPLAAGGGPSGTERASGRDADRSTPTARAIAAQAAQHIVRGVRSGLGRVHIALEPEALGRLDIRLDFRRDGRLSATILADSPETLRLLRQEAPALEQSLNNAGVKTDGDGLSFALRSDPGGSGHARHGDRAPVAADDGGDEAPAEPVRAATAADPGTRPGRLDIRA
jgi:hypothetical protein